MGQPTENHREPLTVIDIAALMDWRPSTVYRRTYDSRKKLDAGRELTATDLPLPTGKVGNSPRWAPDVIDSFIEHYPGRDKGRPTNRHKRESNGNG